MRRGGHAAKLLRNALQVETMVERQAHDNAASAFCVDTERARRGGEQPDAQRVDERRCRGGHWSETVDESSSSLIELRLVDARGKLLIAAQPEALVAEHGDTDRRRYREISSTLRSVDARLGTYIARLRRFQSGKDSEAQEKGSGWDLKSLLELLARQASLGVCPGDDIPIMHACEEAIRNFDGALSEDPWPLIGRARQQLAMARLR